MVLDMEVSNAHSSWVAIFSLDGTTYEIDLTAKNASDLRKAFRPYVEAARPNPGARRRPVRTKIAADMRTVKEWARANGTR